MLPKFKDKTLFTKALTHPSSRQTKNDPGFERLEFLGDRVLGLVIAQGLYDAFPLEKEGALAKRFAKLVSKDTCKNMFFDLNLDKHLNANPEELKVVTSHIFSDTCEAFLGALFLDQGFDVAQKFILDVWNPYLYGEKETTIDDKSRLQEWVQKRYKQTPLYALLGKEGTEHAPSFEVSVTIPNQDPITAKGPTLRLAEKEAARKMILVLGKALK